MGMKEDSCEVGMNEDSDLVQIEGNYCCSEYGRLSFIDRTEKEPHVDKMYQDSDLIKMEEESELMGNQILLGVNQDLDLEDEIQGDSNTDRMEKEYHVDIWKDIQM